MISIAGFKMTSSVAVCVAALSSSPLVAQDRSMPERPAQILVLGTYHFANPGLDVVKTEVADVLSPTKQSEIQAVADAIMRFRPTKIAVERLPSSAAKLDSLYAAYRAGRHALTRDETEQLGFRLAARLEHDRVHPIDVQGEFPFGAVMQYAQENDPAFVSLVQAETARMGAESSRRQRENTVAEILRHANDPENLAAGHGMYMRFARVGAGDTYVGADLVAKWYHRNIRIFSNIQRLAEAGDRILVIIGSGHAPILRELITYDIMTDLVETIEYLPAREK
jgi:hypothetical protein